MKRCRVFLLWAAIIMVGGATLPLAAVPAQVILLRHGEKPPEGPELNARGRERAQALVTLFTRDPRVLEHGPAVGIFAMKPSKGGGSVRAVETMLPTAHALHLNLQTHHLRDDVAGLVQAVLTGKKYDGGTVVICWEHNQLPAILQALGWTKGPDHWRDQDYDRLWILDFEEGKPARFRDLPEKLLPGDAAK